MGSSAQRMVFFSMVRRLAKVSKRALHVVVVLAEVLGALAFLFVLRVAYGPIELDPHRDTLSALLENTFQGTEISLSAPKLLWNADDLSLELSATNVTVKSVKGSGLAVLPEIRFSLSGTGLLNAKLALKRIDVKGVNVELDWSADDVEAQIKAALDKTQDKPTPANLQALFDLLSTSKGGYRFPYLESIGLLDANIRFVEKASGAAWVIDNATFLLQRSDDAMGVAGHVNVRGNSQSTTIGFGTRYGHDGHDEIIFQLNGFNPSLWMAEIGKDGLYQSLNMPLSGEVSIHRSNAQPLVHAAYDIEAGRGTLDIPFFYDEPRAVENISLRGRYESAGKNLYLDEGYIDLGEGSAKIEALLALPKDEGGKPELTLSATVEDISIEQVLTYWPQRFGPKGHLWLSKHMPDGHIIDAQIDTHIPSEHWGNRRPPVDTLKIAFNFKDVTAHYLRPMDPLVGAHGKGWLNLNHLEIDVVGGDVGALPITNTRFVINRMREKGKQRAFASIHADGDLPTIFELIDQEPLKLTRRFKMKKGAVTGHAITHTELRFPLRKKLKPTDIDVLVKGTVADLNIPTLLPGGGLTDGQLSMTVTRTGLSAEGKVKLNAAPFDFRWKEEFKKKDEPGLTSRYELNGTMTPEQLDRFHVPALSFVKNKVFVKLSVEGRGKFLKIARGQADFFGAEINIPKLGWLKPINTPGQATFTLEWEDDLFHINEIDVTAEGMRAHGNMAFRRSDNILHSIHFPRVSSQGHDLIINGDTADDGVMDLVVQGRRFDARDFIYDVFSSSGKKPMRFPDLRLQLHADEGMAANGVMTGNMTMQGENREGYWRWMSVDATYKNGTSLQLRVAPNEAGGRTLSIISDDAGLSALGAGLFLNGLGGQLNLQADITRHDGAEWMDGLLKVNDFKIVKTSPFVQALSDSKGKGVDDMLDAKGMSFDKLRVPFRIERGIIDIGASKAQGPSLGLTFQGQVTQSMKQVNINGIIVPAFGLNSLFNKIPLVGDILLGGKDEGLFALTYRIEGPADNPKFTINPLSALAPGILRKIFEGRKGKVKQEDTPPATPTPSE